MTHRIGTTESANASEPGEEGEPVQEEPPETGGVPTRPVKRRREPAKLEGRPSNEPQDPKSSTG